MYVIRSLSSSHNTQYDIFTAIKYTNVISLSEYKLKDTYMFLSSLLTCLFNFKHQRANIMYILWCIIMAAVQAVGDVTNPNG